MVTAFCHQLGWKNMETLISQFQDRLHFGIHSELLELMKLPSLNGMRARSLFDAGFETISSIALAEANVLENALYKAVPFQSEKEREGDDSDDIRKRNKIKNIWITGCCGMTASEAAANLVSEARKYLEQEIGGEIKWENKNCNTNDVHGNLTKVEEMVTTEIGKKETDTERESCDKSNVLYDNCAKTMLEHDNDFLLNSPSDDSYFVSSSSKRDILPENKNTGSPLKSVINTKLINNIITHGHNEISKIKSSPLINDLVSSNKSSPLAISEDDDIIWGTMNLTGIPIDNISKLRTSAKMFSPDISFGETKVEDIDKISPCKVASESNSLIISDEENSNIFEDSLPLDTIPTKLISDKNDLKDITKLSEKEQTTKYSNMNSDSILNAFQSPVIIDAEEQDEDFKLVYEEDNKVCDDLNEDIITNTQNVVTTYIKPHFISPLKRKAKSSNAKNDFRPTSAKRLKVEPQVKSLEKETTKTGSQETNCTCLTRFTILVRDSKVNCVVLKGKDITLNLHVIEKIMNASVYFATNTSTSLLNEIIGSNILSNQPRLTIKHTEDKMEGPSIKGIAICTGEDNCIFIDVNSLNGDFLLLKNKLRYWFLQENLNLKMICLKTAYKHVKEFFGVDLSACCTDISLAEWLIDSDEKISSVPFLVRYMLTCIISFSRILPVCLINPTFGWNSKYRSDIISIN